MEGLKNVIEILNVAVCFVTEYFLLSQVPFGDKRLENCK